MKPYVLGIDIGGTNTVFGLVDARGAVIASGSIKTRTTATSTLTLKNYTQLPCSLSRLMMQ